MTQKTGTLVCKKHNHYKMIIVWSKVHINSRLQLSNKFLKPASFQTYQISNDKKHPLSSVESHSAWQDMTWTHCRLLVSVTKVLPIGHFFSSCTTAGNDRRSSEIT